MTPELSLLSGEVLGDGPQLEAFSAASLPVQPEKRFAALFAHRQQWAADDLKPYIMSLEVMHCARCDATSDLCWHLVSVTSSMGTMCFGDMRPLVRADVHFLDAGTWAVDRVSAAALHARNAGLMRTAQLFTAHDDSTNRGLQV